MSPAMRTNEAAGFVGLSPTGDVYVTNASANGVGVRAGATGAAKLIETDTGVEITGHGIPTGAAMPTFSPDGSLLVFNDATGDAGHVMALMDYDGAARVASNYREVYRSTDDKLPSWTKQADGTWVPT
jgi:hypothetical protein